MKILEFPQIGDPNLVPQYVGSLLYGPQNKVPPIFGNSNFGFRGYLRGPGMVSGFRVYVLGSLGLLV